MQYRRMPQDSRSLSALGFGVMRLPLEGKRINKTLSEALLREALHQGVNYFDTAYPYINGQSEPFLGQFLEENRVRDKVAIATKLPHWKTRNRGEMEAMLNHQLKRLRTDRIDYYLVHNITGGSWNHLEQRGVLDFLSQAKQSGKILNVGFSWHGTTEDFPQVVDAAEWDFCQIQYNILDERRQAGTAGLHYAAQKGLGVVIMEPLRGGRLASNIPSQAQKAWANLPQKKPAEWALRWVWDKPEVTVLLSGFSCSDHLQESLKLVDEAQPESLTKEEHEGIALVQEAYHQAGAVGCTGCRYCLPCPFGVSIPDVFDWYNEWKTVRKERHQRLFYLATVGGLLSGKSGMAHRCTGCGACLKACPQDLPIPDLMTTISKEYEGQWLQSLDKIGTGWKALMSRQKKKRRNHQK